MIFYYQAIRTYHLNLPESQQVEAVKKHTHTKKKEKKKKKKKIFTDQYRVMLYIKVGGLAVVYFDSVIKNCINEDAIDIVLLDEFSTVMDSNKKSGSTTVSSKCRCNSWFIRPGGIPMAENLTELFHCMWRKEAIPQEFKDAPIIHLFKRKGNPQV